jgi:hypothetical protein
MMFADEKELHPCSMNAGRSWPNACSRSLW